MSDQSAPIEFAAAIARRGVTPERAGVGRLGEVYIGTVIGTSPLRVQAEGSSIERQVVAAIGLTPINGDRLLIVAVGSRNIAIVKVP